MEFKVIGVVSSPFTEKFGIPRQSGLCPSSWGTLVFEKEFSHPDVIRGLDGFSHLWLSFLFHENKNKDIRFVTRPPRLGGNERMGLWATRSPYRINPLGLSVVELENVEMINGRVVIHFKNHDLLNGTPIIDIKPYSVESDCIPHASCGWLERALPSGVIAVKWREPELKPANLRLLSLVEEMILLDPRPRYVKEETNNHFAMRVDSLDFHFIVEDSIATIVEVTK